MNLDKRIQKCRKPLGVFDTEEAKEFIGHKGYFSISSEFFQDLESDYEHDIGILIDVNDTIRPYELETLDTVPRNYNAKYFLPIEWINQEMNRLTPETFKKWFTIGSYLRIRNINKCDHNVKESKLLYCGYNEYNNGLFTVVFGYRAFTLEELFNEWEFYNVTTNSWKRFAI